MSRDPIVIVGAGLAGHTVARELRKLDADLPLMMVTADDGHFHAKPALSNAFAQRRTPEQLVGRRAGVAAEQLRMTLLQRTRVDAIDIAQRTLATSLGHLPLRDAGRSGRPRLAGRRGVASSA